MGARFSVKRVRGFDAPATSSNTAELQSLCVILFVTSYMSWNFRAMGDSRDFLKSVPLERGIYAKPPYGTEPNSNT